MYPDLLVPRLKSITITCFSSVSYNKFKKKNFFFPQYIHVNKNIQIYMNMEFTVSKKRLYIWGNVLPSRVARFIDTHCGVDGETS